MLPLQLIALHGGLLEYDVMLADRYPIYLLILLLLLMQGAGCQVVLMRILVVEMKVPVTISRKGKGLLQLEFLVFK